MPMDYKQYQQEVTADIGDVLANASSTLRNTSQLVSNLVNKL
jgi:hypothetical protein